MRYYYRTVPTMGNLFNEMFDTWNTKKIPPVDVYETKEAYIIEAEVAGYDEKEIRLHVEKDVLTISADEIKSDKKAIVSEIYTPAFERSFSLPESADTDKITADYKNGILLITIPKKENAMTRRIEVKIN